jgi:hypothetical protein
LPIAQARLKIGAHDERRAVAAADKAVMFTVRLEAGRTQLQTWFEDAAGHAVCGAYYVYVERGAIALARQRVTMSDCRPTKGAALKRSW